MAQTGTTFTLQSSSYQGRYLKLTCTSSQDIANNKTNISWKLESIGGSSGHYATIVRVNINGSEVYSIDKGYSYDAFPVTKGSTTGSTSVTMGSDGNKSITIYMDAAIYTSSTTRYSDTWTLNTVPRYPTISSFSVAKISGSSTSVSVSWAGSAPGGSINKVEYSKDNGSTWTNANTTSSPFTISGLTSNTGYNFKIRVTSSASGLTATSSAYWQSTYQQPTANISTANISGYNGLSQIKVSWSSNMDIAKVEYSRDNGSTWYNAGDPNASSGNYTYTGLSENTSYNFKVRVTATTGSCVTTSGTSSLTTRKRVSGNLYVNGTNVATNNGQTGVALKNGDTLEIKDISNGANCSYKLFFENPDNQHQYTSDTKTGTTAISMTAEQIRQRLQYMSSTNSQGFNVGIVTLNGSGQHALYYEFFGTLSVVNSNPTFDENRWTYQDTNANTVALTGSNQILVNGFSKLRVSINTAAAGVNYATISQYTVSGCTSGSSSTTGNIDCPTATNGGTIKVTAKDSRNNSTETTKTATFKNYTIPTMTSISATRSNGGVGTQTTLTFNGTWWNANFGASNNTIAASYRYKSGSTWSEPRAISLTTSGNNYSFNSTIYGDLAADGFTLGTTFTIEVTITDALNGGKQWTTTLSSGTPAIAISGSNVAVGAQYDTNKGGKLQVHGNLNIGGDTQFGENRYDLSEAGFKYNQYGNMIHKRTTNTDTFSIQSNAGVTAVRITPETGDVFVGGHLSTSGNISSSGNVSSSKGSLNNQIDNTRLVPSVSTGSNSSYWVNVCKVKFSSHSQGEFCKVRLYMGNGNNGNTTQNAYIDIVMQLGWTGSVEGRAGVNAILYELNTTFKISNVSIKVIANSNIDYNIFVKPNAGYCRVNYVAHVSTNCNITNVGTTSASAPTGTECSLSFVSSGLAAYPVNSIYMSIVNTSPATFLGGTWERLPVSRYLYNSGGTSWSNSSITGTTTDSQGSHHHGSSAMKADIGFNWTTQNELVEKVRGTFTGGNKRMNNMPSYSEGSYSGSAVAVEGNTDDAGSHSHNIPYIAVFMWRRTA